MEFKDIQNLKQLAGFLGTDKKTLDFYLKNKLIIHDFKKHKSRAHFKKSQVIKMYIPKKNKKLGYRVVFKIQDHTYKKINKEIFYHLKNVYNPPEYVQGFVKGRNIFTNANMHLGKQKILNIDIKDFFQSISFKQVNKAFIDLGYRKNIAKYLTQLTTIDNKLALGLNTSPILANIVIAEMDKELLDLAEKYENVYSRYADDMTFSSNSLIPLINEISDIIKKYGFLLNKKKTKIMKRGQKQYVTGLTVFDNKSPRIPKKYKKRIRQLLFYINKYGFMNHLMHVNDVNKYDFIKNPTLIYYFYFERTRMEFKLKGWIDYINSVEPKFAQKLYKQYNQIDFYRDITIFGLALERIQDSKKNNKK